MIAALLLVVTQATTAPAPPPSVPLHPQTQRSGGAIAVERASLHLAHADIAIETLPDRRALSGRTTLTMLAMQPVQRIVIDLDTNLPASAVAIDGTDLPATLWRHAAGQVVIEHPVAGGRQVRVAVTYAGRPHVAKRPPWDDGMVWSQAPGGQHWFGTTAQGYGCDLWWPCLDFPAGEPQRVDLHITVPAGLSAPAAGVLVGTDRLPDGRTTWHWRSGPVNPYALALSVGPYRELAATHRSRFGNDVPMAFWHLPERTEQAKRLFAEFGPTLDFFEAVVGPYPFPREKLGLVETPYLGMEHQTINAYGNNYAPAVEGFDWLFQHELAHEWFGNQMTARDWDDFWLHEGFANYMQPLYGEWREGAARYVEMMAKQRLRIDAKAPLVSGLSRTPAEMSGTGGPGADVYFKGAWILHTLRGLIGDAAFRRATTRLVYGRPDPQPGNFKPRFATTAEFVALANEESGRDLRWFFDVYLRHAALPDLVLDRAGEQVTLRWQAPGDTPFPLPVEIEVDGRLRRLSMAGGSERFTAPAAARIVLDPMARVLRRSEAIERMQASAAR